MIITRVVGGLGNQLFQYAAGRSLALANEVPLKFDLRDYARHPDRRYVLDEFDVAGGIATPDETEEALRRRNDRRWRKRLQRLHVRPPGGVTFFRERVPCFDPAVERLRAPAYLYGYWQSERYFSGIRSQIREDLHPRFEPGSEALRFASQVLSCVSVAVHVRRGDYVSNPQVRKRLVVCLPDYYRRASGLLASKEPDLHYFVFSDDLEWTREHLTFLDPATFVVLDSPRSDLEEFWIMSQCRHFVIANSTFSWWAAWLGEHPRKQVVAPERWSLGEPGHDSDRYPAAWLRV